MLFLHFYGLLRDNLLISYKNKSWVRAGINFGQVAGPTDSESDLLKFSLM